MSFLVKDLFQIRAFVQWRGARTLAKSSTVGVKKAPIQQPLERPAESPTIPCQSARVYCAGSCTIQLLRQVLTPKQPKPKMPSKWLEAHLATDIAWHSHGSMKCFHLYTTWWTLAVTSSPGYWYLVRMLSATAAVKPVSIPCDPRATS